jgi:hypothetical protein
MKLNRRLFIGTGAVAAATLAAPTVFADGHGKPRSLVVVPVVRQRRATSPKTARARSMSR